MWLAAAVLFATVFTGNIKMSADAPWSDSVAFRVGTLLRLPLHWPIIAWFLTVRRSAS